MGQHGSVDHHHHSGSHAHGSVPLYIVFAVVLCVITFFEWLIFKKRTDWHVTNQILVGALLALSLVKFVMVCGWYMHLRYDNKLLTKVFVVSMIMATLTYVVVATLVQF